MTLRHPAQMTILAVSGDSTHCGRAASRGVVEFVRNDRGEISAVKFSTGRAENVYFEREKQVR